MITEQFAESCAESIRYMLFEQTEEMHSTEVEEEQWVLELGERAGLHLSESRLGDGARFIILDVWPYLYRQNPEVFEALT